MKRVIINSRLVFLAFCTLFGCASSSGWKDSRVMQIEGKNKVIVRKGAYCLNSQKEYSQVFDNAIKVNEGILTAFKECSLKGAVDILYCFVWGWSSYPDCVANSNLINQNSWLGLFLGGFGDDFYTLRFLATSLH